MASKVIEAILRVSADVAAGIGGLRQLRQEAQATKRDVAAAGAGGGNAAAAKAAASAEKAATTEAQAERKKRTTADKLAAAEQLAAARAAANAKLEADRAARRQARAEEEADRKRQRKAQAQVDRDELQATAARARAQREERRKLAQLAPQVTDIATGLASGQNPALVALQQGGQIMDIFGGGLEGAKKGASALLGVFTPMRVAVGGVVGGVALLVTQLLKGVNEAENLRHTMALTGNVMRTTIGQMNQVAEGTARATGITIGLARDLVTQLIAVEGQTGNTLETTAKAAGGIARLTGQSAEEVAKVFGDQASGVTEWARKANAAYNFLKPEQVAYIRTLEQQGRVQEAIKFTNEQLAASLAQRTGPAVGNLDRAWQGLKNTFSSWLDAIRGWGRDTTLEDKIKAQQQKIEALQGVMAGTHLPKLSWSIDPRSFQEQLQAAEAELRGLNRQALRGTENDAATAQALQDIKDQAKATQESITALSLAESQKRLAQQMGDLDKLQAAIELQHARGLVSEADYAAKLNAVDQRRLKAQIEAQQKQVDAARAAVAVQEKPEDVRAAQARVAEAEATLLQTQARLAATVTQGRSIVEADLLAKSRDRAQAWADVWLQAEQRIRDLARDNALTAADRDSNPLNRARATAAAQVRDLQRELKEQQAALQLQIDLAITPGSKKALQDQLTQLTAEGNARITEATRLAQQQSLSTQMAEQLERVRLAEQAIDQQVQQGALTTEEAERRKFEARDKALPQLRLLLDAMRALATTDAERNAVDGLVLQLDTLADRTDEVARTMRASFTGAFSQLLTDIGTQGGSVLDKIGSFLANIGKAFQNLINQRLSEQLAKSLFGTGNGSNGALGGFVNWLSSLFVTTKHTGGLVDGGISMGRAVAPWIFAGAQVLHSGGIAGLAPDEQPAILRVGEEVLTEDNPRHIKNWRGGSSPVIGSLNVSVSTTGTGTAAGDAQMAEGLKRGFVQVCEQYVVDQMRPGGLLAHLNQG